MTKKCQCSLLEARRWLGCLQKMIANLLIIIGFQIGLIVLLLKMHQQRKMQLDQSMNYTFWSVPYDIFN